MSGIDLRAINGELISGLSRISNGSSSLRSSGTSSTSATQLSIGLRTGARLFTKAIAGLNNLVSTTNLTKSSLTELGSIVDEMIGLAEKATKSSLSDTSRRRLDREFQGLIKDFRKVAEREVDDKNVLTKDGLSEIFGLFGLDPEKRKTIEKVFDEFLLTKDDSALASEEIKGKRPIIVPAGAYPTNTTPSTYQLRKLSDSTTGITDGYVSTVNGVYSDDDDTMNQNPTNSESIYVQSDNGNLNSLPSSISSDVVLKSVSETSGYSIVSSHEDFLGYNPSNYNQLFLVDTSGQVVHQYTNLTAELNIGVADLSADGMKAVFEVDDGASVIQLGEVEVGTLGEDPATSTLNLMDGFGYGSTTINNMRISESGDYVAYSLSGFGLHQIKLRDTATFSTDSFLANEFATTTAVFGFLANDTLGLQDTSGKVKAYTFGDAAYGNVTSDATTSNAIAFSETGHIAYRTKAGQVQTISELDLISGGSSNTVGVVTSAYEGRLSIASDGNGGVKVGFVANLQAESGDPHTELYVFSKNYFSDVNQTARKPTEFTKVLDGHIKDRPNAYKTLEDLRALRSQIDENLTAIDDVFDILKKNIELVRVAGLSFLEVSDSIRSSDDADSLALQIQRKIRQGGRENLSEVGNLEPLLVFGLTQEEGSSSN